MPASQKVSITSFGKSQFPPTSDNLSFLITNIKGKLTDLCGNRMLQHVFTNTFVQNAVPWFREFRAVAAGWNDERSYAGAATLRQRSPMSYEATPAFVFNPSGVPASPWIGCSERNRAVRESLPCIRESKSV